MTTPPEQGAGDSIDSQPTQTPSGSGIDCAYSNSRPHEGSEPSQQSWSRKESAIEQEKHNGTKNNEPVYRPLDQPQDLWNSSNRVRTIHGTWQPSQSRVQEAPSTDNSPQTSHGSDVDGAYSNCPVHKQDQIQEREKRSVKERIELAHVLWKDEIKELVPRGAVPAMVFTGIQKGLCRVFPWPRRGEDNINIGTCIKISINVRRKTKPLTFTPRLEWGVLPFNTICFWAFYMFHFRIIYSWERYTWF